MDHDEDSWSLRENTMMIHKGTQSEEISVKGLKYTMEFKSKLHFKFFEPLI